MNANARMRRGRLQSLGIALLVVTMLILLGAALGGSALAVNEATVRIAPALSPVTRGDTFAVDVEIEDAADLGSYEFTLVFDPTVVEVVEVVDASFLGSTGRTVFDTPADIDNVAGTVTFAAASFDAGEPLPGAAGDGTLAVVTLQAVGRGASDLELDEVILTDTDGEPAPVAAVDGAVESLFQFELLPSSAGIAVNPGLFTETVQVVGALNLGSYEFSLAFDPAVVQVVEVADASFLGSTGRTVEITVSDLDNVAGTVTFAAASSGAGIPGPDGPGPLALITFETLAFSDTDLVLSDLMSSDILGAEEVPEGVDGHVRVVPWSVALEIAEESVSNCAIVTATVVAGDVEDLGAYEFTLAFDSAVLQALAVEDASFLGSTGRTVQPVDPVIDNAAGTLTFAAASVDGATAGPNGDGVLATVTFEAVDPGASDLELLDVILADTAGVELVVPVAALAELEVAGEAQEFEFDPIGDQVAGEPFAFTLTAIDEDGLCAEPFAGEVTLSDSTGTITPTVVSFTGCTATLTTTVTLMDPAVVITAAGVNECGESISGESDPFEVARGATAAVTIAPQTATAAVCESIAYTLTAEDAFGNAEDVTAQADFSVEAGAGGAFVAHVYTAENPGVWEVTGEFEGFTDDAELTVVYGVVDLVEVAPAAVTLMVGETQQFAATVYNAFACVVDIAPVWSLDDADAGTIDGDGLFTAAQPGVYPALVVATAGGVDGTADVTIEAHVLYLPLVSRGPTP